MTFSLSGTTITQSGTDTDLSGLSGIAGVDYVEFTGGEYTYRQVVLPTNHKLVIEGDLTIDANTDMLIIPHSSGGFLCLDIAASGSLTIADQATDGANTAYYQKKALHILNQTDNHWNAGQGVVVSGNLIMNGGAIFASSHINFLAGSSLTIEGESLIAIGTAKNNSKNLFRFYNSQADVSIDGLILQGGSNAFESAVFSRLDNYSPQFAQEGIMAVGDVALNSYNPQNCDKDFAFGNVANVGSEYTIYGIADQAVTASIHFNFTTNPDSWLKVRKLLNLTMLDEGNAPISGVASYIRDTDHGARYNKLEDLTADIEYLEISDASGQAQHDILLANIQHSASDVLTLNSAPLPVDYRTKNNSHNYKIDAAVFSYGHQPRIVNDIDLTGLDQSADVVLILSDDSRITEHDQAVVAAYSEIATAPQFYDAAKFWRLNNYEGQGEALVTIEGGDTIISDYDITIDANASQAFDFDGTTITIKAGIFEDNLRLDDNSEVTKLNGAEVSGTIQDMHGDSVVMVTTPTGYDDEVKLYESLADADLGGTTGLISSGDIFRYNAADYGGATIYVRMETASELFAITSYQVPNDEGIYDAMLLTSTTELELASISSKIDSLTIKTRNIEASTL